MMNPKARTYELEALTDIWTGTARVEQQFVKKTQSHELVDVVDSSRLISTGLLGSIRWWFEVLVRGLGGASCDPSANQKACLEDMHCVVCELFGCTGWARKVRFDVRNVQGAIIQTKLTKGTTFSLRFMPLRAVRAEEWALLDLTLRLISEFGALGGKTVLKPSMQNNKAQHGDFGLVRWATSKASTTPLTHSREQLAQYVSTWANKPAVNEAAWSTCKQMWFVAGKHLTRQDQNKSTFNLVIKRPEPKAIRLKGTRGSLEAEA